MGAAKKVRNDLGALETSASFLADVAELLQVPQKRVARSMIGRAIFTFKTQRWYIHSGAQMRRELVTAVLRVGRFGQDWTSTQFAGGWLCPTTCEGQMRNCAAPRCPNCKRRAVMIARGIARLARRTLGANKPEMAWLLLPRCGADNSRLPHSVRLSVKTSALQLIRGSPTCEASWDYWPGKKALNRSASFWWDYWPAIKR